MRIFNIVAASALVGAVALSAPVQAYEAGDILLRFGPTTVQPDASSDPLPLVGGEVDVSDDTQLGITGTYMVNEWFGVELLASTPYEHNIYAQDSSGRDLIGETKHLPPTLMAQLHLPNAGKFRPYIGFGVNHTIFFEESLRDTNGRGIPAGFSLDLDNSTGAAGEIGVDVALQGDWFLNASVWQVNIETTGTIEDQNGAKVGDVDITIDPVVWMLGVGRVF